MPESNKQNGPPYLLDTQTCGAILMRSDAGVMRRLEEVAVGDVAISAVTLSELMYAVTMSRRTEQDWAALDLLLRHVAAAGVSGCCGCQVCGYGRGVLLPGWEGWGA
jgi:predicted nucleic acid-binding protein